nr:Dipeptidyl aminopeptidase BIII [Chlamydiota bacterium]
GILDVEDCISAAKTLVEKGLADPKRLLIKGGSAGGYTTLAALAFHNVFAGGTSYYGVSDLELLYEDTHKFEAQYTDILVGPYPEAIDLIRERSPTNHVEKISAPVLLLQGDEDKVVPPNQSFKIYEALKKKGVPVGMILFEGEGHGFRKAPNIKRSLDAELYFYSQILGIDLPQAFEKPPVEIISNYVD